MICGAVLTTLAFLGLTTPWLLLLFCVLFGSGSALYSPSWQASIGEQVSVERLPAAIALGSISYNIARSVGPAIGGLIVGVFGAKAGFGLNACFFLPLFLAFIAWQRKHLPSRLPPERIDRAIAAGARYARHSPAIRSVMTRVFLFAVASASTAALAPLVAKQLLRGDALVYGLLLGSQGIGAVIGVLFMRDLRLRFTTESIVRGCTVATALGLIVVGLSRSLPLSCIALFIGGGCNIVSFSQLNVSVQLSSPRWVSARALSLYSSALTGGVAFGAVLWGRVAANSSVQTAFIASAAAVASTLLLGWLMPLAQTQDEHTDMVQIGADPEVGLDLTMRSGPVVIEVEYDVDPDLAREFYAAMTRMERVRRRIGGFDWSIARDIANPALWIERYHCPTWGDYLRMRDHYTKAEHEVQKVVDGFNRSPQGRRVRRSLVRPFGSVRWKADSPDLYTGAMDYIGP